MGEHSKPVYWCNVAVINFNYATNMRAGLALPNPCWRGCLRSDATRSRAERHVRSWATIPTRRIARGAHGGARARSARRSRLGGARARSAERELETANEGVGDAMFDIDDDSDGYTYSGLAEDDEELTLE